jgi:hypothetical protein
MVQGLFVPKNGLFANAPGDQRLEQQARNDWPYPAVEASCGLPGLWMKTSTALLSLPRIVDLAAVLVRSTITTTK